MNRSHALAARSAVLACAAAVAALTLAGCGGSPAGSGSAGQQPSSGASTKASSSSSGPGNAVTTAAAYFPVGAGYTWKYEELGLGGKGAATDKVLSVTPTSAGQRAVLSHTITYPARKTSTETLLFRPDGSVQVPLTQFGNASVTLESGAIVWPSAAQLASGQPYTDTIVMKIDLAGHAERMTMPLTVKGEGTAAVTVPAGTYQTTLISETMSTSMDGFKFSIAVRTWVANGVGPVKSEVSSSALSGSSSGPLSTEELVSFSK